MSDLRRTVAKDLRSLLNSVATPAEIAEWAFNTYLDNATHQDDLVVDTLLDLAKMDDPAFTPPTNELWTIVNRLEEVSMRILLVYYDQNDEFARELPRTGSVAAKFSMAGSEDWILLNVDNPIRYQGEVYSEVAIRSRWEGRPISTVEPTSVFILLPRKSPALAPEPSLDDFDHVAWGMATVLDN
jgi:hypothetical protein